MKADKLKGSQQITFCEKLLAEGKSRKEVVDAMMAEFTLTRRTATTYVYLWFRGDDYKVAKPKNVAKDESSSSGPTTKSKGVGSKTGKKTQPSFNVASTVTGRTPAV